ncbi:Odorant receptor 131-2 [Dissostichus eleginoides]|uniref:Odorant receptor 131-2 n=1 Tax=Dissostichus eleginoides TaxID=100907 RepID=A0AAD9CIH8_DISEL|nr:Odorant receptor 131-2 [Dissostichus eleginoides]
MTQFLLFRETFTSMFFKNLMVVLVWLLLSYINGSLVATFFRHQTFYEDPRYILFIHMVINDSIQLTVTVTLFLLSYIVYRINVSFCCFFILVYEQLLEMLNSSDPLQLFPGSNNSSSLTGGATVNLNKEDFSSALTKNIVAMLVWLMLSVINGSMVHTFLKHRLFYENPRYIMFICMVINDALQLSLVTALYVVSYIFRKIHASVCCFLIMTANCVFDGVYLSFVALTLLYTYCKIMLAAQAASTGLASVKRARNTVLLHGLQLLLCMLAFVVPSLQADLISLFPRFSLEIRYIFFLVVYIIPRFLSPVIYGFRDEHFRKYWTRYLSCRGKTVSRVRPVLQKGNI